ncbi:transposase family protein [Actinomadura graeca]|uniref:Transposase family protein n=1 Tax=Actinomadura graeca TaxID=2750812 RepID=A0ABX8R9S5_9ACTN|nr:transposase family protein [Actinomadura graeca]
MADRVLLMAVYYRANLTLRQVALLFGVSKSAAHRIVDHLAPLLTLASVSQRHGPDTVLIVDGTLVPTHDRSVSASSKNYRCSVNMQVVIDADPTPAWSSRSAGPFLATTTIALRSGTAVWTSPAKVRM